MIAVFVHLFYQDLWDEIKSHLDRLKIKYDLYVTICEDHDLSIIKTIENYKPSSIVMTIANRGADIGPFFEKLNLCFDQDKKYEWILKIHSKKSLLVSPSRGESWRKSSYSALLPKDFSKVQDLLSNFKVGMIGPRSNLMSLSSVDRKLKKNNNLENINYFRKRLSISDSELKFFAGTMFWIRYSILEQTFKNNRLTALDFGKGHAPDGTKAHAMERVFANIVRDKKYELACI